MLNTGVIKANLRIKKPEQWDLTELQDVTTTSKKNCVCVCCYEGATAIIQK